MRPIDYFARGAALDPLRPFLIGNGQRYSYGVGSAMIVGHNPGLQDLVLMMAGRGDAIERVRAKYPTGALATIDFAVEAWSAAAPGTGRLARLVTPRDLEG